jgi:hypothetical protein
MSLKSRIVWKVRTEARPCPFRDGYRRGSRFEEQCRDEIGGGWRRRDGDLDVGRFAMSG